MASAAACVQLAGAAIPWGASVRPHIGRQDTMTKATITKTWIIGLIVLAAGIVVTGVSVGLMLAFSGEFTPAASGNGYDFTPTLDGFFWSTVAFIVVGSFIILSGAIVQLVAWVEALLLTYRIPEKTWFVVLLAAGLLSFGFAPIGFAAMIAYIVAGPDESATMPRLPVPPQPVTEAPPKTLVPTG